MRTLSQLAAFSLFALFTNPVAAEVKLAYIDPLSGGAASAGINAQKHFLYLVDKINAAGGLNGEKLSISFYDNKVDPQESLIALRKALDEGARYIFQGNGSAVALALSDAILKYNERNPGKEVLYFNYAAVDPALTNAKCNFWHFRFDSDADMKMSALVTQIAKTPQVKKIYLINQDYSFGRAVEAAAKKMIGEKRPDIQIVGDELHPLQKVQDFSPYVAKIKASGADAVITGNWSNDMFLLLKAGRSRSMAEAGRADRRRSARPRRSAATAMASSKSSRPTTRTCRRSSIPTSPPSRSASPPRKTSSITTGSIRRS